MPQNRPLADPPLTSEQRQKVSSLLPVELSSIDQALLRHVSEDWRKIARVVGFAMSEPVSRVPGIPDVFYAQRVRRLVEVGTLESRGDILAMGLGEVKFASRVPSAI
jgi:hypothetical protein